MDHKRMYVISTMWPTVDFIILLRLLDNMFLKLENSKYRILPTYPYIIYSCCPCPCVCELLLNG